jgi:diguanylate cyclase (GGDEF)-like protein/PAS domain S-box-containing protein
MPWHIRGRGFPPDLASAGATGGRQGEMHGLMLNTKKNVVNRNRAEARFPPVSVVGVRRNLRAFIKRWTSINSAILVLAVLLIAAIWVMTLQRARFEESEAEAAAVRENTNLAIAFEEHTASTLKGVEQALELVMHEYRQFGPWFDLNSLIPGGTGIYSFVAVLDQKGDISVGSRILANSPNARDREYFQFHRDSPSSALFVGKPLIGRASGKWTIPMTRRIDNADGTFGGVVLASVDAAYFTDFYQKANLGRNGLAVLVGRDDGIARARRIGDEVTHAHDMRKSTLMQEVAARRDGQFLGVGSMDGVARYASYRSLKQYPLVVAVGTSRDEVLIPFRSRQRDYRLDAALASVLIVLVAAGFIVALSRQKRDSQALAASEAQLRATFDQTAVGIVHVGQDGQFLRVNGQACEILGYAEPELLVRSMLDVAHRDDRRAVLAFRRLLAGKGRQGASLWKEARGVRKDGLVIWLSTAATLVLDPDGKPDYFVGMVRDVSANKAVEARYRATFNQAAMGVSHCALDGRFIGANAALAQIFGYTQSELLEKNLSDILAPGIIAESYEDRRLLEAGEIESSLREFRYIKKDGSPGWALRGLSPVRDAAGKVDYFISVVKDITERKRVEAELRESRDNFEQLVSHIPEAFWIQDLKRQELIYLSPAHEEILGAEFPSLQEAWRGWTDAIHPEDRERALTAHRNMNYEPLDQRYRVRRKDGTIRWVHARGFPVTDQDGNVYRIAGTIEDITVRQELEARLQQLAHFDPLTGLPNRVLCYDRLNQAIARGRRNKDKVGVMFLDLDRFKAVNDTLGHLVGDELLRQVAGRPEGCLRTGDTVGRLGGDEFTVVLGDLAQPGDAALVAQKVIDALKQPFSLGSREVFISSSVGIALFPGDGENAETLLKNADGAMFRAKSLGRSTYCMYTAEMNAQALENRDGA